MSIRIEDFLYEYFNIEQLKDALYDIGVPFGKTKEECVNLLLDKWISRNRSWIDILEYLEYEDLCDICDHFNIIYYEGVEHPEDLIDKIEKNRIIDFTKKYVPKTIPSKSKSKITPYVVYVLIGWMGIGIVLAILNFGGVFLEPRFEEIDISKKYQVAYESWTDENTLTGIFEGMSLTGKIILESTQFSAHNKIDVQIELSPNTGSSIKDIILLDSITPPINVYFVGAQYYDIENEYTLADILLKRSLDGTKLVGEGTIIYTKGGNYEIYLLDSSEISLKQELLTVHEPNGSLVMFLEQENTVNPNGYFDENGNQLRVPTRVEFFSENEPYVVEIKQSDSLNSLSSDKMAAFVTWITLAFVPLTVISALKYLPIKFQNISGH